MLGTMKTEYLKILVASTVILISLTLSADDSDYKLKAAYVYNIAKFTTWPARSFKDENTPLKIAILGRAPTGMHLKSLNDQMISKHPIKVINISDIRECGDCHIIFISDEYKNNMKAIKAALNESPILTISDMDEFIKSGGLVSLDPVNHRLAISINLPEVKSKGLEFSSKLLKLAVIVE